MGDASGDHSERAPVTGDPTLAARVAIRQPGAPGFSSAPVARRAMLDAGDGPGRARASRVPRPTLACAPRSHRARPDARGARPRADSPAAPHGPGGDSHRG